MTDNMDDLRQASADVSGVQILSPAAQTVMDAAVAINDLVCTDSIAAALRAAVDQAKETPWPGRIESVGAMWMRDQLLAIADELEQLDA